MLSVGSPTARGKDSQKMIRKSERQRRNMTRVQCTTIKRSEKITQFKKPNKSNISDAR